MDIKKTLQDHGLSAYFQPHEDMFLLEYTPPQAERLARLTGFTGSSGSALLVAKGKNILFIDGRYTLQAEKETNPDQFLYRPLDEVGESIAQLLPAGKIGYNPDLISKKRISSLRKSTPNLSWIPLCPDIFGAIAPLEAPPYEHALAHAGESTDSKIKRLVKTMRVRGVQGTLIADPSIVNWILNIRGSDVPYTPLFLAFLVLQQDESWGLFTFKERILKTQKMLQTASVHPLEDLAPYLEECRGMTFAVHADGISESLYDLMDEKGITLREGEPIGLLEKSIKNVVEIKGATLTHVEDGVVWAKLLSDLSQSVDSPKTDVSVAKNIAHLRKITTQTYREESFGAIVAPGSCAAIVHYSPNPNRPVPIDPEQLLLIDCGGQYVTGTTDCTRTISFRPPSTSLRRAYTAVLRAHLAPMMTPFPTRTTGGDVDRRAREILAKKDMFYGHGTGHGVGSFSSVHEGPISFKENHPSILRAGMLVTVEPGHYVAESYGIRIENLCVVRATEDGLLLDPITRVPYDQSLIEVRDLRQNERNWIDRYHHMTYETLHRRLDETERRWLREATAPLKNS